MRPNTGQHKLQHQQQFCAIDSKLAYVQQGLAPPVAAQTTNFSQHHHPPHHLQQQSSSPGYSNHHHQNQQQQSLQQSQHLQKQHQQHTQPQPHPNHNHVVSHTGTMPHHPHHHHPPQMWVGGPQLNTSHFGTPGNGINQHHLNNHNRGHFPPHARHFSHGPPQHPPSHVATLHHQQSPLTASHHLHHGSVGAYNSGGPPNSSDRMAPLTPPNYAKLPPLTAVNQQRINECAGIPLISTATAHLTPGQRQRISRKQSHSPPGKNWSNNMNASVAQPSSFVAAQYAAVHVQGAPLMMNKQPKPLEFWSAGNTLMPRNGSNQNPNPTQQKQSTTGLQQYRTPLRYQNSAPAALTSSNKSSKNDNEATQLNTTKESVENTNSSSSNAGDSSNSNETCLPRIIKPRKRRKKDRKPPSNLVNAVYMKMEAKSGENKNHNLMAMKAYKSSEDLLKCLQKFSQISSNNNETQKVHDSELMKKEQNDSAFGSQTPKPTCQQNSNNHGICFCVDCDPLRCIWEYPLRRSMSDSSSTSSTSGTGSLSDGNLSNNEMESPTQWSKNRADIVGVIGSKRVNKECNTKSYHDRGNDLSAFANNILEGINLSNDLFKSCTPFSKSLSHGQDVPLILLPETAETLLTRSINEISQKLIETCSNEANELTTTTTTLSSCNSLSSFSTTASCCCSSSSQSNSSANSSCCGADFATDSGIESAHINAGDDLVFNFDHLHIAEATATTATTNEVVDTILSMSSCSTATSPSVLPPASLLRLGNNSSTSMSMSSPTDKLNKKSTNFLTPLTPGINNKQPVITIASATTTAGNAIPTLESFLVDLNNNEIPKTTTTMAMTTATTTTANKTFDKGMDQQQQHQFIALATKLQPPHHHHHLHQAQSQSQLQQHQQQLEHDQQHQQFLNNCYDLMWHQQQRQQLGNLSDHLLPTTSSSSSQLSLSSLSANTPASNATNISSFLESVGSLKNLFSTIS